MQKILVSSLLVSIFFCSHAQSDRNVEKSLFKINALLPGVNYELGVGQRTTLNFELGLIPEGGANPIERGRGGPIEIFPYLGVDFRYFTNMERRLRKGKNILGNSGNYVAFANRLLVAAPLLGNLEYDNPFPYVGGFLYGIQRTYKKGFYWGVSFGPAFYTGDNDPSVGILNDIKIGWVLGK